ncbi:MAG: DNA-directed RNA polymerase subunit omega [Candidatus Woesearchaeota archaeon]|jgi:DNA-directed RNA polymerase subunit K/omega|nr:DNA-directed RNA polymerase subunit omega [Candidatus Woesearchaeota archaeon]
MSKKLNKFEMTRLLSARAYELERGAKAEVEITKKGKVLSKDYVEVAQREFDEGKLSLDVFDIE